MSKRKEREQAMTKGYRYTECGLDNVFVEGVTVKTDEEGDLYCFPNVNGLHKAIAYDIITHDSGISAKELRFLRTEMGMTQEEMADLLKVSRVTVSRWETGKEHIPPTAEFVMRVLAAEKLSIDPSISAEEMARSCVWRAETRVIEIDGSNPENYVPKAA